MFQSRSFPTRTIRLSWKNSGPHSGAKRKKWRDGVNFFVRVLMIRVKLFCKFEIVGEGSGDARSRFLWPWPGRKLLLVAVSLLPLMLPRETVYISYTKARMSRPAYMSNVFVTVFLQGRK